jgi:hypothetical protein
MPGAHALRSIENWFRRYQWVLAAPEVIFMIADSMTADVMW